MDKFNFQYCQKIVVFSQDNSKVLLAKRVGESDFDRTFSFIGGKMEDTDKNPIEGMRREKDEEVGKNFKIRLFPTFCTVEYFVKKDGHAMVLPHYYAQHVSGEIILNGEYSEFQWIPVSQLADFHPIIANIPKTVENLLKLVPLMNEKEFVEI